MITLTAAWPMPAVGSSASGTASAVAAAAPARAPSSNPAALTPRWSGPLGQHPPGGPAPSGCPAQQHTGQKRHQRQRHQHHRDELAAVGPAEQRPRSWVWPRWWLVKRWPRVLGPAWRRRRCPGRRRGPRCRCTSAGPRGAGGLVAGRGHQGDMACLGQPGRLAGVALVASTWGRGPAGWHPPGRCRAGRRRRRGGGSSPAGWESARQRGRVGVEGEGHAGGGDPIGIVQVHHGHLWCCGVVGSSRHRPSRPSVGLSVAAAWRSGRPGEDRL
jgi:hypothetical protein